MQHLHELEQRIVAAETKLEETLEDARSTRGPLQDSLRVVVPMMQDQLQLMKDILDYAQPRN